MRLGGPSSFTMSRLNLNFKIFGASMGGPLSFTMCRLNLNCKIFGVRMGGVSHLSL